MEYEWGLVMTAMRENWEYHRRRRLTEGNVIVSWSLVCESVVLLSPPCPPAVEPLRPSGADAWVPSRARGSGPGVVS